MKQDTHTLLDQVDTLRVQWSDFALEPDARLLRWLVTQDEVAAVSALIELEDDEDGGELPDMFIVHDGPFENPYSYGYAILRTLRERFEASRKDIEEAGLCAGWEPPEAGLDDTDVMILCRGAESFQTKYQELVRTVTFFLRPKEVYDVERFQHWLLDFAKEAPATVRAIVIDDAAAPVARALEGDPVHVHSVPANLAGSDGDAPPAIDDSTPGGKLALAMESLASAAEQQDTILAVSSAEQALAICEENSWPHLKVPALFSLGSIYLAQQKPIEALPFFRDAEVSAGDAQKAEIAGDPAPRLMVTARMGTASVLYAAGAFEKASEHYQGTVPFADKTGDLSAELECWRMAAHCESQRGADPAAWRFGREALAVAERMEEKDREHSTLTYAGEALFELTKMRAFARERTELESKMIALTGRRDWKPSESGGVSPPMTQAEVPA